MDYRTAGVDLAAAADLVDSIGPTVTSTWDSEVVSRFGGFAAGVRIPAGYTRPVLMMTTDSVGTKGEVARLAGNYDGLGFDLVAMSVDDLAAVGARPLGLVDYLAVGRIDPDRDRRLIESVAAACRVAGCALLGGETAEHPGTMDPDRFDLAGAALGIVEEGHQIEGSSIVLGDRLVGVASPNLRSNGFSLVRAALLPKLSLEDPFPGSDRSTAEVLLEPSVIYAPAVLAALEESPAHGLAHITGGGLEANLSRVLPEGCRAIIDRDTWDPPPVFRVVAEVGAIAEEEMFRTFNMGVGFVAVAPPQSVRAFIEVFADHGHHAWELGAIRE